MFQLLSNAVIVGVKTPHVERLDQYLVKWMLTSDPELINQKTLVTYQEICLKRASMRLSQTQLSLILQFLDRFFDRMTIPGPLRKNLRHLLH